jgi:hypothetical protein
VVCFAHVTNQMGTGTNDFDKGESDGGVDALRLLTLLVGSWKEIVGGYTS